MLRFSNPTNGDSVLKSYIILVMHLVSYKWGVSPIGRPMSCKYYIIGGSVCCSNKGVSVMAKSKWWIEDQEYS